MLVWSSLPRRSTFSHINHTGPGVFWAKLRLHASDCTERCLFGASPLTTSLFCHVHHACQGVSGTELRLLSATAPNDARLKQAPHRIACLLRSCRGVCGADFCLPASDCTERCLYGAALSAASLAYYVHHACRGVRDAVLRLPASGCPERWGYQTALLTTVPSSFQVDHACRGVCGAGVRRAAIC